MYMHACKRLGLSRRRSLLWWLGCWRSDFDLFALLIKTLFIYSVKWTSSCGWGSVREHRATPYALCPATNSRETRTTTRFAEYWPWGRMHGRRWSGATTISIVKLRTWRANRIASISRWSRSLAVVPACRVGREDTTVRTRTTSSADEHTGGKLSGAAPTAWWSYHNSVESRPQWLALEQQ